MNTMVKLSLWISALAILLERGIADEPFCLVKILSIVTPDRFFRNAISACQDLELKFDHVRNEIRKCTDLKISVDKLESLHNEFCDMNSEFKKRFDKSKECIEDLPDADSCFGKMADGDGYFGSTQKAMCSSFVQDISKCQNERVRRCGDGLEVYKRLTEAQEPILTAICLETAGGAAANTVFFWCLLLGVLLAVMGHRY